MRTVFLFVRTIFLDVVRELRKANVTEKIEKFKKIENKTKGTVQPSVRETIFFQILVVDVPS